MGDAWAWWVKFERMHGTGEHVEEVVRGAVGAEPHHGLVWQGVAKDDGNRGKGVREVLELVVAALR